MTTAPASTCRRTAGTRIFNVIRTYSTAMERSTFYTTEMNSVGGASAWPCSSAESALVGLLDHRLLDQLVVRGQTFAYGGYRVEHHDIDDGKPGNKFVGKLPIFE